MASVPNPHKGTANWFQNTISDIGKAFGAPTIFDWDTDAARSDAWDYGESNTKRGLDSAAGREVQAHLSRANPQDPNYNNRGDYIGDTTDNSSVDANYIAQQSAAQAAAQRAAALEQQANPLRQALSSLDIVRDNRRGEIDSEYDRNIGAYDEQMEQDRATYDKQVTQNEQNQAGNRQAALLAAARGGSGLRSVLGSLGALSGSGAQLADRAIQTEANKDIGEADRAFNTSADTINTAWSNTEREDRQRRLDAEAAKTNRLNQADQDYFSNRQNVLTQLANLFGVDTTQGAQYASEAGSLYPQIASASRTAVADYAPSSSLYSPQALETYKAGTRDMTVGNTIGAGGDALNAPLVAGSDRRRREEELA